MGMKKSDRDVKFMVFESDFPAKFMAGFEDRNVNLRVVDPPESKIEIPHQNIKIALMAAYKMRKQMHGNKLKMQE